MYYFSGFSDEASTDFRKQIEAATELGWENIESRKIGDKDLSSLTEEEFEVVSGLLTDGGIKINCYGSAVANWGKDPRRQEDFDASIKELRNVIPRMEKLGIKTLRGMSFAVVKDADPDSREIRTLVFSKVRELVKMCEDAGVLYLHENCMNYGGMSSDHTLRLIEEVNSPNFGLVFDTGNPVMTWDRRGKAPYRKQCSWDFYKAVREHINYVHIKDGRYIGETDRIFPDVDWTFAGEGDGDVRRIVKDLLASGYEGGFSIEPHMTVVFHEESAGTREELQYRNFIEYGRRFMQLVNSARRGGFRRGPFIAGPCNDR